MLSGDVKVSLIITVLLHFILQTDAQVCMGQLGISSGGVSNEQLVASSFRNSLTSPVYGRLNDAKGYGGWCAATSYDQFIQVDLLAPTYISGISTQGRNFYIGREEYVLDYTVAYANISESWVVYQNGQRITANINADTIISNMFNSPILARYVRIFPQRFFGGSPCLRFELLGCYTNEPCEGDLGMQDGSIQDSQLSSSGTSVQGAGVTYARLNGPSAWCLVASTVSPGTHYLQIDLLRPTRIVGVATQGQSNSFVRDYAVGYCTSAQESSCQFHLDNNQNQIITGNTNGDTVKFHTLNPTFVARLVRIYPVDFNQAPCMRVELFGCEIGGGITSYNTTLGSPSQTPSYLDSTYSGTVTSLSGSRTAYTGGRGKLTDGILGSDDTRANNGNNWIGWHKTTYPQPELLIQLNAELVLYTLKFYISHYPAQDTSVFEMAYVSFSKDGYRFGPEIKYTPVIGFNTTTKRAGYITLGVVGKACIALKCRFQHGSQNLLLISELELQTINSDQTPTISTAGNNITTVSTTTSPITTSSTIAPSTSVAISTTQEGTTAKVTTPVPTTPTTTKSDATTSTVASTTITSTTSQPDPTTAAATTRPITQQTESTSAAPATTSTTQTATTSTTQTATIETKETKSTTIGTFGSADTGFRTATRVEDIVLYVLASLFFLVSLILLICACKIRRRHNRIYYVPNTSAFELTRQQTTKSIRSEKSDGESTVAKRGSSQKFNKHTDLLIVHQSSARNEIYFENVQGVCGNNLYQVNAMRQYLFYHRAEEQEFQDSQFSDKQLIGNGTFGQIYTAVLKQGDGEAIRKQIVSIKISKPDVEDCVEDQVNIEKDILSRLRHDNIAQFYGTITDESHLTTVVEYCEYGDLHQFLVAHSPVTKSGRQSICEALHAGTLTEIASQIALGMEYLANMDIIHRDLSIRNCLVVDRYHVKISNLAMSRAVHSASYCNFESRANLPIRWMAPETIALGGYTKHSDIWSYGVTLWELFTYADFPFENMSDQQVIANAYRILKESKSKKILSKPEYANDTIYDIMKKCWIKTPEKRTNFGEIIVRLRKS